VTRLAVAVRPPARVLAALDRLPRPPVPRVTWARPEQLVVKLRPLGHVAADLVDPLVEALGAALDGAPAARCRLGPVTHRTDGQWLAAPVAGLDELAAAVFEATEPVVPVTHPRPFAGELVLARGRVPAELAGGPVDGGWTAEAVVLVADRSSPRGPRLDDLAAFALAPR
jgi:2'-5' RNA ligase